MTKFHLGLVAGAVALALAAPGQAQTAEGSDESIEQCRNIADASARLDCYDRISEIDAVTDPAPIEPETPSQGFESEAAVENDPALAEPGPAILEASEDAADESEPAVLTDDIGLPKPADAYKPIPITISRCGEASNRKWYFYLDNGQVWQYLGARKLRYRQCDAPGRLIEDRMGFSLQMDGDPALHRVKRVR